MPKYKALKSVAHNIGHSFTSLMNFAGDDYVMGHILRLARSTGVDTLQINLAAGEGSPKELFADPISNVPAWESKKFWDLVQRHGSDRPYVRAATLVLRYNLTVQRPAPSPQFTESPYVCDVRIVDIRGKNYDAHFEGWWYPEQPDSNKGKTKRYWWRFWG
jgi:hypothetical protein